MYKVLPHTYKHAPAQKASHNVCLHTPTDNSAKTHYLSCLKTLSKSMPKPYERG